MSGTGSGSVTEETNGTTYALSEAWVTFSGMKIVLAFSIDRLGNVLDTDDDERWCTVEITDADGTTTYNDSRFSELTKTDVGLIWAQLEAILAGTGTSGPLE